MPDGRVEDGREETPAPGRWVVVTGGVARPAALATKGRWPTAGLARAALGPPTSERGVVLPAVSVRTLTFEGTRTMPGLDGGREALYGEVEPEPPMILAGLI